MKQVGTQVDKLIARAINDRPRAEAGLPVQSKTMHLVFTGDPGTGKTTVAKEFGPLYKALGLVPEGQFIEAKNTDLIGSVMGETQEKTQKMFDKARGGVLFIDEAYSLVHGDQDMYGKQAIDVLVNEMYKHRDDTVVILAGYPEPMKKLLKTNPGLASRVPTTIHFPSYSQTDAVKIFRHFGSKGHYTFAPGTQKAVEAAVGQIDHGNAREVESLYSEVVQVNAARNASAEGSGKRPSTAALRRLTPDDVARGLAAYQANRLEQSGPRPRKRKPVKA